MARMTKTEIDRRILEYVSRYYDGNGYAPSFREIAAELGFHSPSTAYSHVKRMEAEGKLNMRRKGSRSVLPCRQVSIPVCTGNTAQRIRLGVAGGGSAYFDCSITHYPDGTASVSFSGILDTTELKGGLNQVVACSIEE